MSGHMSGLCTAEGPDISDPGRGLNVYDEMHYLAL